MPLSGEPRDIAVSCAGMGSGSWGAPPLTDIQVFPFFHLLAPVSYWGGIHPDGPGTAHLSASIIEAAPSAGVLEVKPLTENLQDFRDVAEKGAKDEVAP